MQHDKTFGPVRGSVPARYENLVFAQINKGERLGRAADFLGAIRMRTVGVGHQFENAAAQGDLNDGGFNTVAGRDDVEHHLGGDAFRRGGYQSYQRGQGAWAPPWTMHLDSSARVHLRRGVF